MGSRIFHLLLFLSISTVFSQREAANWYFGRNAGLDFNSGSPRVLLDGSLDTIEGCESFSDANGNLIFYTDGKTVWNRFHEVMPNGEGLKGSFSTSQSALVVPHPQRNNIYYIFTPDDALTLKAREETNGFNYTIVDMDLDDFRGAVTQKNVELLPRTSEKVSAVKNFDENFYWVVTHFENRFYSYRVDANGLATQPVISQTGPLIDSFENTRGNIKISPDGTKLAISHTIVEPEFAGSFYLFDFDASTGVVSNPILVSDSRVYYGVEFSSNSSKLYASGVDFFEVNDTLRLGSINVVQFDLDAPNTVGSEYVVQSFPNISDVSVAGSLQLAIDKKIYHSIPNERLSVIRTPNLEDINVDFRPFSVDLGGRFATYGLPPFIQSFFETIVKIENFCEGSETTFTIESLGNIASINWNFGDPNSGVDNFSAEPNPTHVFSSFGLYTVTLNITYTNGSSRQFIEFVEIAEVPNVVDEVALVQCDIDGVDDGITTFNLNEAIALFNNGNDDITALFFGNEADAWANINQLDPEAYTNAFAGEQLYARAFENAECFAIVRVDLVAQPMSDLGTYDTVYICNATIAPLGENIDAQEVYDWLYPDFQGYDAISLYRTKDQALFEKDELPLELLWFGIFDPFPRELYFRVEENNGCAFLGRVELNITGKPEFDEHVQVNLCNGQVDLEAPDGFETYVWSGDEEAKSISVNAPGSVHVVFGNGPCSYVQHFEVLPERTIGVEEVIIEDFRFNNRVTVILASDESAENMWYSLDAGANFQESNTFSNVLPGLYDLVLNDGCGREERELLVGGMPAFFTPNGDGMHDEISLYNPEFFPAYTLSIFNRYGKLLKTLTEQDNGWDGTYLNQDMPAGGYWYVLELANGRTIRGNFSLKR